jgi:phosphomevalonate kinase
VALVPFFTGVSADTAQLVARVGAARDADRSAVDAALTAIAEASRAACAALAAPPDIAPIALIGAIALAADATDRLAAATRIDLVPACVTAARRALARLGGTAKTTGAGGGDVGVAVVPAGVDETETARLLIEAGCQPLRMAVDDTGVDLRPGAS